MALDKDTGNSLFGSFKSKAQQPEQAKEIAANVEVEKPKEIAPHQPQEITQPASQKPKWETLDKVTVLLTPEQKEGLDRVAKKIMKHRTKELKGVEDKERITANTLMRALVENFLALEDSIEMEVLTSENDVQAWIKKTFL